MAEFFCELFSEEIPARMQTRAIEDLCRLIGEALAPLLPRDIRGFSGPRRLAVVAELAQSVAATRSLERGPRTSAPEAAIAGFLRKHGAGREALRQEGEFWVLERVSAETPAARLVAEVMPGLLRRFPWPKSMRWGDTSQFTWVRPLRRIVCLLDGAVVPWSLVSGDDDGHGLAASDLTEGHRAYAPGAFAVRDAAGWQAQLLARRVIADAAAREAAIDAGIATRAEALGVVAVRDAGLLAEVAGLVEWPVVLAGRIDDAFMDLPAEVMQVSMRVNQRYFATRTRDGRVSPWFLFAANLEAPDGGAAIVAGNERVLRARFSDARHFWDLDRRTPLADRVAALDGVTFHANLGSQGSRIRRMERLSSLISGSFPTQTEFFGVLSSRAALLAKADLTSGMVREFPELQGVMGSYYAANDEENVAVVGAIRDHYLPRSLNDKLPTGSVGVTVALADKIDQLAAFFTIGQRPTGSGDPFALRRAGLGILRIIRENNLPLALRGLLTVAVALVKEDIIGLAVQELHPDIDLADEILVFLAERMRVLLKHDGRRDDVIASVLGDAHSGNILEFLQKVDALSALLDTDDGRNLLAAYKRASNILEIESRKDGPFNGLVDVAELVEPEEYELYNTLPMRDHLMELLDSGSYAECMRELSTLRRPLDAFFKSVMVNAADPKLRKNRLLLLSGVRQLMNNVANFGHIKSESD